MCPLFLHSMYDDLPDSSQANSAAAHATSARLERMEIAFLLNHEANEGSYEADRKHICRVCGKRFNKSSLLQDHELTHTGERPHACDTCGKSFPRKYILKQHILREHTTPKKHRSQHEYERLYICDICYAAFAELRDLSNHQQLHTR